mmetsp:Transcript_56313/g.158733  ORF Transcript_56313/g.158733 Transcript_56313/m.158733 type:complete len:647 (-) Transcript_56313:156-2096(-)
MFRQRILVAYTHEVASGKLGQPRRPAGGRPTKKRKEKPIGALVLTAPPTGDRGPCLNGKFRVEMNHVSRRGRDHMSCPWPLVPPPAQRSLEEEAAQVLAVRRLLDRPRAPLAGGARLLPALQQVLVPGLHGPPVRVAERLRLVRLRVQVDVRRVDAVRVLVLGVVVLPGVVLRVPAVPRLVDLDVVVPDVLVQDGPEDEGGEDRGPEQRPDQDGEGLLADQVPGGPHLGDEVGELGPPDHRPADHPPRFPHVERAQDLRHDAGPDAHDGALPEGLDGEELLDGDGEGDRAAEEDADHPRRQPLRLLHPDAGSVVLRLEAGEGHAGDEAAPEVGAAEVGDQAVPDEQEQHAQEEELVGAAELGLPLLLRHVGEDVLLQELGPELHREEDREAHEGDPDDGGEERVREVEVAVPDAEDDVEEDQRQDVVHERRRHDRLPELLAQHARLAQEAQRDADARGRQRRARDEGVGHDGVPERHHQEGPRDQRPERAEHRDDAGPRPHDLRHLEVEVHAALEDHHGHADVPHQREDLGRLLAVTGEVLHARADQALLVGIVLEVVPVVVVTAVAVVCLVVAGLQDDVTVEGLRERPVVLHSGAQRPQAALGLAINVPAELAVDILGAHEANDAGAQNHSNGNLGNDGRDPQRL